jgi:hypothetical protein
MRSAALFVMLGIAVGLNGCGSSSNGGTGGAGGATGKGGSGGSAGVSGGTGGSAGVSGGTGGSAGVSGGAGTAGGAGTTGSGGAGGALAACGDATGAGEGETCNSVIPMGPCVTETFSTATPPSPAGGTIVAGTYNLTTLTAYVAADAGVATGQIGQVGRQTFVLTSGTSSASPSLTLAQAQSSGTAIARSSGPVAISGMTATFTPTCPVTDGGGQGGTDQFTATSTGFTLFETKDNGATVVSVFMKVL